MDPISTPVLAALARGRLGRRGWLLLATLVATPPASAVALAATAFVSYRKAKAALEDLQDAPDPNRAQRLEQALRSRVAVDPAFKDDMAAWAETIRRELARNPKTLHELEDAPPQPAAASSTRPGYEVHFDFRHPIVHGQGVNGDHRVW